MTSINSVTKAQESTATTTAKSVGENIQNASAFAEQLATASSTLNAAGVPASVSDAINTVKAVAPAMDIGFDFNPNAISASGLNSSEFLSQTLRSGIKEQFNLLGNDIATSLIAGLAGQDSATAVSEDTSTETSTTVAETEATNASSDTEEAASKSIANANVDSVQEVADTGEEQLLAEAETVATENGASSSFASLFPQAVRNLFEDLSFLNFNKDEELAEEESDSNLEEQVTSSDEQVTGVSEEPVIG